MDSRVERCHRVALPTPTNQATDKEKEKRQIYVMEMEDNTRAITIKWTHTELDAFIRMVLHSQLLADARLRKGTNGGDVACTRKLSHTEHTPANAHCCCLFNVRVTRSPIAHPHFCVCSVHSFFSAMFRRCYHNVN